jgi:hypothetical protein
MNEEYMKVISSGGRPIPGQSLTSDPNNPAPYEKPPQFTTIHEASEFLFEKFIDADTYTDLMTVLDDGVPIMDVVQTTLFAGFSEGKWNPDLLMLLVEPTAYMLLGLAERADIDPIIYRDQQEDEFDEDYDSDMSPQQQKLQMLAKSLDVSKVEEELPPEMVAKIESIPAPESLMGKSEEAQMTTNESSLLAPPPVEEEV